MDGVGPIGDGDESVELDVLEPEAIAAAAPAIQGPDWKLRRVRFQVHLECGTVTRRHRDAGRKIETDSTARGVGRVSEARDDRIRTALACVIVDLNGFVKSLRLVQRVVPKREA